MMAARQKDERIPVYLRIRPCTDGVNRCLRVIDAASMEVHAPNAPGIVHRGEYSHIFHEKASQHEVFLKSALPLVDGIVYHQRDALLIAYGASGSGKTHTVSGTISRNTSRIRHTKADANSDEGVLSQAIRHIFKCTEACNQLSNVRPTNFADLTFITAEKVKSFEVASEAPSGPSKKSKRDSCGIWLSVIQVYNEVVTDLLDQGKPKALSLAQDANGRCFVRDASWHKVDSDDMAFALLTDARCKQKVASTKLNDRSSRSHFITFIKIIRNIGNDFKVNQLVIADLAGNERSKASGGTGNVLRQAGFINCSLLVLGRCVDAIRRGLRNIPYRDSKLTRLLSPFLAGKGSLLSLIVCVNPHKDRVDDTLATLKFSALASELTQPAEVVKRFQETRRKSAHAATFLPAVDPEPGAQPIQQDVVTLPVHIFQEMQHGLEMGESLARENEEIRRSLQLREEALENSRLMHEDRLTALRAEYHSEVRKIREEHREAREVIETELRQHCIELEAKCAKYKKQAGLLAEVCKKRLYPELDRYRALYGSLEEFPPMQEEDLAKYGKTSDPVKHVLECSRCCLLQVQLDDTSRQLQTKIHESERMVEELRSERELRVLLQEKTRGYQTMSSQIWSTTMEYTCRSRSASRGRIEPPSSGYIDSGHMLDQKMPPEESESGRLMDELRERLIQQIALTEQLEIASRDRIAEITNELKKERMERRLIEMTRDQLASRLDEALCSLGCDRCKQIMRLREVPQTAPTRHVVRYRTPKVAVRESKLTYTPVFRRPSATSTTSGADSPSINRNIRQRRLVVGDSD
ncbi:kinesin-like protein KIF23 [Varroa jacobsoni]|uniref:kinesin-like protein KIF23 n=1 Tax=Varroa jacobsoni TaxID=62625 RepID=UPI000BF3EDC2|nr:kinesin-like protein KIF23 [Varroa jacobsoni]